MTTPVTTYLDSFCVNQEEGHALEQDVKEEGGLTEEGVDQLRVSLHRSQDVGQLLGQLLVNRALVAAFGHSGGTEHILQQMAHLIVLHQGTEHELK